MHRYYFLWIIALGMTAWLAVQDKEEMTGGGVVEKGITGDNLLTRGFQGRHRAWLIPAQEID